jgi:hypothetical protein
MLAKPEWVGQKDLSWQFICVRAAVHDVVLHVAAALLVSVVRGGHQQEAGPDAVGDVLLRQVRRKLGLSVTVRHVDGSALVCRRGHSAQDFASARISIPNGLAHPPLFQQINLLNLCIETHIFPHQKRKFPAGPGEATENHFTFFLRCQGTKVQARHARYSEIRNP